MATKKDPSEKEQGSKGRVQINFRLDVELLERIDSVAARYGISRTEVFLRSAGIVCDRPELLLDTTLDTTLDGEGKPSIADRVTALEEALPLGFPTDCNLEEVISRMLDVRLKALDSKLDNPSNAPLKEINSPLDKMLDKAQDPSVLSDILSSNGEIESSTPLEIAEDMSSSLSSNGEVESSTPLEIAEDMSSSPSRNRIKLNSNGEDFEEVATPVEAIKPEVEELKISAKKPEGANVHIPDELRKGLTTGQMMARFGDLSKAAFTKPKQDPKKLAAWSQEKDPDNIPWRWDGGKRLYFPI